MKIRDKCSLTAIEFLLVLCFLFILLGTFAVYAQFILKAAREQALRNELNYIRLSIEHYRVVKGRLPQDLHSLMNKSFAFKVSDAKIINKRFLKPFRADKESNLLDPFRNKYYYDKKEGRVFSQTKGYQNW